MKQKLLTLFLMGCTFYLNAQLLMEHPDNGVRLNFIAKKYNITGEDIVVGIEDVNRINVDKINYRNRIIFKSTNPAPPSDNHPNHVVMRSMDSGNLVPFKQRGIFGTNILSPYKADNSKLNDYYYNDLLRVVNRSLGSGKPAGKYSAEAEKRDLQTINHREFIYCYASGNYRMKNDRGDYGFYSIGGDYELFDGDRRWATLSGGPQHSKNGITVNSFLIEDTPTRGGSSGPAYDGRIKPDITATGNATSFSSPLVAAAYAGLTQAYREQHPGITPNSAYLKAILLNSADDVGHRGPDFRTGFGRINARRAYLSMQDDQAAKVELSQGEVKIVQFAGAGTGDLVIPDIPNVEWAQLKIMVYWHDAEGVTYDETNSNTYKALINDINMEVKQTSGSTITHFLPLVPDHRNTGGVNYIDDAAIPKVDTLNNVEQVLIDNPLPGDIIRVKLTGFDINTLDPQECFVVYDLVPKELVLTHPVEGFNHEKFSQTNEEYIRWDAYGFAETDKFKLYYRVNNEPWQHFVTIQNDNGAASPGNQEFDYENDTDRHHPWTVPDDISNFDKIKIKIEARSNQGTLLATSVSGNITVVEDVRGVNVDWVLWEDEPNGIRKASLSWSEVDGATSYNVYRLGIDEKYMSSPVNTIHPQITISDFATGPNGNTVSSDDWNEWVAIAPVFAGIEGRRSTAIEIPRDDIIPTSFSLLGATQVTTRSALLHARLTPGEDMNINSVQFQYARNIGDPANFVFENIGAPHNDSNNGYTENTVITQEWNNIWNPQLNTDQEYVYRIELIIDSDGDGIPDPTPIHSDYLPVQVPGGAEVELDSDQFYTLRSIPEYSGNASRTIEFWATPTAFNNGNLINIGQASLSSTAQDALIFGTGASQNEWQWRINDATEHYFIVPETDNKTNHFAIVYDGSAQKLSLIVNGAEVPASIIENLILDTDPEEVQIGGQFKGSIDEVRFWAGARSINEIREHIHYPITEDMTGGIASGYPESLLRYLQFDDETSRPLEAVNLKKISDNSTLGHSISRIPLGAPGSGKHLETISVANFFQGQGTWIYPDPSWDTNDDLSVSSIHTKPHRLTPNLEVIGLDPGYEVVHIFDRDYRVVHHYFASNPLASYRVKMILALEQTDLSAMENIKLLGRAANSKGVWYQISEPYEIDYNATEDVYKVTFNSINNFGQLLAVRVAPTPNSMLQEEELELHFEATVQSDSMGDLKIFPNPISNKEKLSIKLESLQGDESLIIFDQLGRQIRRSSMQTLQTELDISDLSNGIYIIQLLRNDQVAVNQKLIVINP